MIITNMIYKQNFRAARQSNPYLISLISTGWFEWFARYLLLRINKTLDIKNTSIFSLSHNTLFRNNSCNKFSRSNIKSWIPARHTLGRTTCVNHFFCRPFLNLDTITVFQLNVQSSKRCRNIKWNIVLVRTKSKHISSYFVSRISIGTHSISSNNTRICPLGSHQCRSGRIANERSVGHFFFHNLERGKSRSLIVRTRFKAVDAFKFIHRMKRSSNSKCSTIFGSSK
mmetsp:Transcript_21559/g.31913  ORF Transcript_21559/g.31913 Transcript_21559/m.31913 type:complete len:227 (-) Transcript_21559:652-1332(-)